MATWQANLQELVQQRISLYEKFNMVRLHSLHGCIEFCFCIAKLQMVFRWQSGRQICKNWFSNTTIVGSTPTTRPGATVLFFVLQA
jgi:hypothetical protein